MNCSSIKLQIINIDANLTTDCYSKVDKIPKKSEETDAHKD